MKHKVKVRDVLFYRENVPCMQACPVHTDSGRYVQLIAEGRFKEAYMIARSPNPLASVCGRICSAPCEDVCSRGRHDAPVPIRALKRFLTERYGSESRNKVPLDEFVKTYDELASTRIWDLTNIGKFRDETNREKKVAIIGAGPAGIACAHDLALMGYQVTVFEAMESPGGMLLHGVPAYRLPKDILLREVFSISDLGVEFVFNRPVTTSFGISDLKKMGYSAIFIAVGAGVGKQLNIEGSNLEGIYRALDFLFQVNKGHYIKLGKKVVVIGGGLVAIDAARTALRDAFIYETGTAENNNAKEAIDKAAQAEGVRVAMDVARSAARVGAIDITVIALESEEELPAAQTLQGKLELEEARKEGIKFMFSWGPKRFLGEQGRVQGVEIWKVKRVFDEQGRFNPEFIEGTEEVVKADNVILAIGQMPDLSFIKEEDGIEITPWGTIKVDPDTLQTTAEGVFAGGDAAFGPRIAIEAIENGKRAAQSINNYLKGSSKKIMVHVRIEELDPELYSREDGYEQIPRREPDKELDVARVGFKEVERVYTEEQAIEQAKRCLICHTTPIYEPDLCILCGFCAEICPTNTLRFVPIDSIEFENDGEKVVLKEIEGEGTAFIKDESTCIRCGLCAKRCPTGAIKMERFSFKEEAI